MQIINESSRPYNSLPYTSQPFSTFHYLKHYIIILKHSPYGKLVHLRIHVKVCKGVVVRYHFINQLT